METNIVQKFFACWETSASKDDQAAPMFERRSFLWDLLKLIVDLSLS